VRSILREAHGPRGGRRGPGSSVLALTVILVLPLLVPASAAFVSTSAAGSIQHSPRPGSSWQHGGVDGLGRAGPGGAPSSSEGPWTYSVSNQSLGLPGDSPSPAAYDPATGETFIAEYPHYLAVTGASPLGVIATVIVGELPSAIAVLPSQGEVFVANSGSDNVSVVSAVSLQVIASIAVGAFPSAIAYDNASGLLAVANELSLNVTWIDPTSFRATSATSTGLEASAATYDPSNRELYLTGQNASDGWPEVAWIDPSAPSVSGALSGIGGGGFMAFDPATSEVFADGGPVDCACFAPDAVSVVNASNQLVGSITTSPTPEGLGYDPINGAMLAVIWAGSNWTGTDAVVVLDPRNFTEFNFTQFPGACPQSLAIDAAGDQALIANSCGTTLARLSLSNGTLTPVPVSGGGPDALLFDPANGDLLVANEYSSNLTVWSTSAGRALRSVPVGAGPDGLTYDPISGDVYVANAGSNNVTVVDGATFARVGSIPVGSYPDGITFDPNDDEVWVANYGSSSVTVISAASNTVVASVPNQPGPIAVVYDGGAGAVFVADSLNGSLGVIHPSDLGSPTWDFLPGTPLSLAYDPGTREVDVGDLVAVEILGVLRTDLVHPATSTLATISLYGGVVAISDLSGAIVANPPAGDFPYAISVDAATSEVLTANLNDGNVSVFSSGTLQPVTAVAAGTAPEAIATNATTGVAAVGDFGANALTFLRPSRELPTYSLNFSETGLVSGTWSVSLDGYEYNAAAGTPIVVSATNGTYAYAVSGPVGYLPDPATGSVRVAGSAVNTTVSFLPTIPPLGVFLVTFTEQGACGVSWGVSLNGSLGVGLVGSSIVFHEPNGSYRFAVAPSIGCRGSPSNGTLIVQGGPMAELITYSPYPPLASSSGRWTPLLTVALLIAGGLIGVGGGAIVLWNERRGTRRAS
jgi:YVTN family beta-propeller protein